MRRRITVLVAATTSAVVVAFIVPLCLLVLNLAEGRAVNAAQQEAQTAAILLASVSSPADARQAVRLLAQDATSALAVLGPDGRVVLGGRSLTAGDVAALRAARRSQSATTTRSVGGATAVVPVATADGVSVVRAHVTGAQLRSGVPGAWATIAALGVALVAAAVLIARVLGTRVSTPVVELAGTAHRLREGDLAARASPSGPSEVVELGHALNQLADRIEELLVAERETVADLSHRLRTPVTALRLDAEAVPDAEVAARLTEHVDHLQRTVDAVVADARRPVRSTMGETADAATVLRERAAFWRPLAEDTGRDLRVGAPAAPTVVAAGAEDLVELLDTLLENVFSHTPEGTPVELELTRRDGLARIVVADGGPGLAPGALARGRSTSGSSGLGLDIARRIAHSAGGELTVGSSRLGGVAVTVTLRLAG